MAGLKIASALVLGLLGLTLALLGLNESDSSASRLAVAPASISAPGSLEQVVVARRSIARGGVVTLAALDVAEMKSPVPAGAFGDPLLLKGAVALENLSAGQIVLEEEVMQGPGARPSLAVLVPEGMRAVALRVTDEVAVGNFVRPGDRVDIQLILPEQKEERRADGTVTGPYEHQSRVLLENVEVLTVGNELAGEEQNQAARMQNITVAVSSDNALLISLAKERGRFYLALRHPLDERPASSRAMRIPDLIGRRVEPSGRPARKSSAPPKSDQWVVEVMRGTSSELLSGRRQAR